MTADPDFIPSSVTNRFQSATTNNITSPKAQARLKQQQKNYSNEIISLRLVPPPSTSSLQKNNDDIEAASSEWNIPRFRLTESFLSEVVNRGRPSSKKYHRAGHVGNRLRTNIWAKEEELCRLQLRLETQYASYQLCTLLYSG